MGKRKLLYLLLMAFLLPLTAFAQKALPYEYGFENNDLAADGWTVNGGVKNTKIINTSSYVNSGTYAFQFWYTTTPPQYLISPELTGATYGVDVSFKYRGRQASYDETFCVGYSTTTADVDAFTWGAENSCKTATYTEFATTLPAGTKYVAIKYTANNQYALYLDDFKFTASPSCKPIEKITNVEVSYDQFAVTFAPLDTEQDTWQVACAKLTDINFNDFDDHSMYTIMTVNSTTATITGLEPETQYVYDVRAFCGGDDYSDWKGPYGPVTTEKRYPEPTNLTASNIGPKSADISWTAGRDESAWNLRYGTKAENAPTIETWLKYDNGVMASAAGLSGNNFSWAVMFPAGTSANTVSKVAVYDYAAMTGTVAIYNDGATAPGGQAIIEEDIELTGSDEFVEINFSNPVELDPSKNMWVVITTSSYSGYPAAYCDDTNNANGRWVELSGSWYDVQAVGLSDAGSWMLRAYGEASDPDAIDWIETVTANKNKYTIENLTPETTYFVEVQGIFGSGEEEVSAWSGRTTFTTTDITPADVAAENITATSADLTWDGSSCSYDVRLGTPDPDAPMIETELKYDDDEYANSIGAGGQFWWASVFNGVASVTSVSVYDYQAMTGTVTIYNGGTTAPEGDPVAELDIELTGSNSFVEVESRDPIELDPTKPTWVVIYNESGAQYPAAYSSVSNANGRWVSLDGSSWMDVASAVSNVGCWMIRLTAEAADPDAIIWNETVSTSDTSYTFEGLDPETAYFAEVRTNCEEDDEISDWVRVSFTTLDAETPITDVVAENITKSSADIDWTVNGAEDTWNLRYRKVAGTSWGFEEGMDDWFAVDADGDGYGWELASESTPFEAHGGNDMVVSASYINNVGALTPDNWLVSPEVTLGGTLTFWAKGQDASWCAENFGVFVTTTSMDADSFDATAFTQVDADVTATGEWTLYTFDLGAYSGTGHFALRHYDIQDMFYLDVDDINYLAPGEVEEDWTEVDGITEHPYTIEDLDEETRYEVQVQSVYDTTQSDWTESVFFTTASELIVLDNDSEQPEGETNTDLLEAAKGKTVDFTISGRTLYKDGTWNTIALPFILTEEEIENSPLAGATIKTVDPETSVIEGTHVTLNMMDYKDWCEYNELSINLLYPSYPYLVKWEDEGEDIVDPTFRGVTIYQSEPGIWALNEEESIIGYGLFSSIMLQPASQLGEDESPIYYMGADNKLKFTGKARLLNAFRAGFSFETPEDAGALSFTINWGDETTTGIVEIDGADSKATAPTGIFNLQGVKLNQLPKQKGVYINNGKKVIIK